MDADTQRAIAALKEEMHILSYKVSTLEIDTGKHVCWCGPAGASPNRCMICHRHINNPTVGDCGCPNGYCTCQH
jgi:hypothetical protein